MGADEEGDVVVLAGLELEDDVDVGVEELLDARLPEVGRRVEAHLVEAGRQRREVVLGGWCAQREMNETSASMGEEGSMVSSTSAVGVGGGLAELRPVLACDRANVLVKIEDLVQDGIHQVMVRPCALANRVTGIPAAGLPRVVSRACEDSEDEAILARV